MHGLEMKYFVLKPPKEGPHGFASRQAMRAYADAINRVDPKMAEQLRGWANREAPTING